MSDDKPVVYPPGDIRNTNPSAGPFMIQIKYLADTTGGVRMQIIAPEIAPAVMIGDMLRLAYNMTSPVVVDPQAKARSNKVWHFLKGIGSALRAPPQSSIN